LRRAGVNWVQKSTSRTRSTPFSYRPGPASNLAVNMTACENAPHVKFPPPNLREGRGVSD